MNTRSLQKIAIGLIVVGIVVVAWSAFVQIDDFSYEYIDPREINEYRSQEYQVLDFRTPTEQELGTLTPTTFTIDLSTDASIKADLQSLNPDGRYIIYDRNGEHVTTIVDILAEYGFDDVKVVQGGYQGWIIQTGQ